MCLTLRSLMWCWQAMTRSIDQSDVVLVFVTNNYMLKCDKDDNDNCKLEFDYAYVKKQTARMIAVVMEEGLHLTAQWSGPVCAALGLNPSFDLSTPKRTNDNLPRLCQEIRRRCT